MMVGLFGGVLLSRPWLDRGLLPKPWLARELSTSVSESASIRVAGSSLTTSMAKIERFGNLKGIDGAPTMLTLFDRRA